MAVLTESDLHAIMLIITTLAVQHRWSEHWRGFAGCGHCEPLDVGFHPPTGSHLWLPVWSLWLVLVRNTEMGASVEDSVGDMCIVDMFAVQRFKCF